jgi:hypothetical protein
MWFHLCVANHNPIGRETLYDMIQWLIAGLTENGHEVTVGDRVAPSAMNILWDNFREGDEEVLSKEDFRYGLIATEIPTGDTMNWLDEPPWPERRRAFDRVGRRAEFIWSMVEAPVTEYQERAPAGYLELGFSERILDPVFAREPEADFGFYGLVTPHRAAVLQTLQAHFRVTTPATFMRGVEINRFIASFKIGVCFKQSPRWPIPSPTRLGRLLHARRGIAAEFTPVSTRQGEFVPIARETDDFAEFCAECLRGPWKARADEAFERFRAAMPMKQIVERLLDTTLMRSSGARTLAASDDGVRMDVRFLAPQESLFEYYSSHSGYNLFRHSSVYIGVRQGVEHVDLRQNPLELGTYNDGREVVTATSHERLIARIDRSIELESVLFVRDAEPRFQRLETALGETERRVAGLERRLIDMAHDAAAMTATLAERDKRLATFRKAIAELGSRLDALTSANQSQDREVNSLKAAVDRVRKLARHRVRKQAQHTEWQDKILDDLKRAIHNLRKQLETTPARRIRHLISRSVARFGRRA